MIGRADFYALPVSLSSGEYPLIPRSGIPNTYLVTSFENVKHSLNIQQDIRVPLFPRYEDVNICVMDDLVYWVTLWTEEANGEIRFVLDLAAASTFIRKNDTVSGYWKKTPVELSSLHEEISNSTPRVVRKWALPQIGNNLQLTEITGQDLTRNKIVYCAQIYATSISPQTQISEAVNFGTFCRTVTDVPSWRPWRFDGTDLKDYSSNKWATYLDITDRIYQTMGGTSWSVVPDNIFTSVVSVRAAVKTRSNGNQAATLRNNTPVTGVQFGTSGLHYTDLEPTGSSTGADPCIVDMTIPITDERVRLCGQLQIRTRDGGIAGNIPIEGRSAINATMQTVADQSGFYTFIYVWKDRVGGLIEQIVLIPESQGPYMGNTWAQYRQHQAQVDVAQHEMTMQQAAYQAETDRNVGIANAVVEGVNTAVMGAAGASLFNAGAPAALGAAMGVLVTATKTGISEYESRRNLKLKEMESRHATVLSQIKAKTQAQQVYNTGYTINYIIQEALNPTRFELVLPENITQDYYDAWRYKFGYAAQGYGEFNAVEGFYQGSIVNDGTVTGQYFDLVNEDLERGFTFKEI